MADIIKRLNYCRYVKFYNRGYDELAKIIYYSSVDKTKCAFHVKRANWIYNLCIKREKFKSEIINSDFSLCSMFNWMWARKRTRPL